MQRTVTGCPRTAAIPASIARPAALGLLLEERLLLREAEGHDRAVDGDGAALEDERLGRRVRAQVFDDGRPGGEQLVERRVGAAAGATAVAARRAGVGSVGGRGGCGARRRWLRQSSIGPFGARSAAAPGRRACPIGTEPGARSPRRRVGRRAWLSGCDGAGRRQPEPRCGPAARGALGRLGRRTSRARAGSGARRSRHGSDRWRQGGGRRRPARRDRGGRRQGR